MRQFYSMSWLWTGSYPESDYPTFWATVTNDLDDHLRDVLPKDSEGALLPGPVRYWPPSFKIRCSSRGSPVDVVGGPFLRLVVSDRVRRVAEEIASGQAEFLPVSLIRSTRLVTREPFFCLNPLIEFDALDWSATRFKPWKEPRVRELLPESPEPLLVASVIPTNVHIFMLKWYSKTTFVSFEMRESLAMADVEGIDFSPMPQRE